MGDFKFGLKDLMYVFTGEGSQDLVEWFDKLELVAKSIKQLPPLETAVPMLLSGGAYSVYRGLPDDVKKDYKTLKEALMTAFVIDSASAYEQFSSRRLQPRESVDVYLADISRLARLVDPHVSDVWIKHAFVAGLPDAAKERLRTADHLSRLQLGAVVERARVFVNESGSDVHSRLGCASSQPASVVADVHSRLGPQRSEEPKADVLQQMLSTLLTTHPSIAGRAANAPPPAPSSVAALSERPAKKRFLSKEVKEAQQKAPNKLVCFRCSGYGHFARHCPSRDQTDAGNE